MLFRSKDGRSIYWAGLNKGKRSIAVDLRNPRGRELLSALIAAPGEGGGIFTTNMPARGWLSYEELSKKRADLIALNIVGDRHGTANVDYTVNAITGFPMVTGAVGQQGPVNAVAPPWDLATAYAGAMAILAAERHRRITGKGQRIDISMLRATTHLQTARIGEFLARGKVAAEHHLVTIVEPDNLPVGSSMWHIRSDPLDHSAARYQHRPGSVSGQRRQTHHPFART